MAGPAVYIAGEGGTATSDVIDDERQTDERVAKVRRSSATACTIFSVSSLFQCRRAVRGRVALSWYERGTGALE